MSNLDNIYDNELINQYRQRNNILRRTLQNTRRRMLRCQEDLNKARNPTAGTGSTQGGGKRKNKSRKMKGGFMTLTADFVKNNFDHFAENGIEIEIEIEGRRQKIIIHKNLHPDTDQPIDYINTTGTYFLYTLSQSAAANQPVPLVDLTDYNPGDVKINISNPQSGSGRKNKSRKKRGGFQAWMGLTKDFVKNNFDLLVERKTKIKIKVGQIIGEERREEDVRNIIIHKDKDEDGNIIDYRDTDGRYFVYRDPDVHYDADDEVEIIDLEDYIPGDIKINILNPQSGGGRKKRGGFKHGQLVEIKWGNIDGGFDWWRARIIADNGGPTIKVWWLGLETPDGFPLHEVISRPRPGDIRILQGKTKGGRRKSRKIKGGHHLYKRLGVSKYASQKQIRKAYNKLKKKKRVTSKIRHAYNILSKKKSRRKYNLRYKTRKH